MCKCSRTGRHLATFTRQPGSGLYTVTTASTQVAESGQVAASSRVSASGQLVASCSCRVLSHQTLFWHHRLGHPSLPRLCSMHSCLLRAAPHSSEFPPTTAPLQTLHMDVWGPAPVGGTDRERYFLLVVDDYTRYTIVLPLRRKADVSGVLIPWIRATRHHLRERFRWDFPVPRLHSDRGGEFSSDLLAEFCRDEGICQSFTLPASPQQNGIVEHRIGLIMELNLWPRVSEPETSPTFWWTGKVADATVFRVWGALSLVRDAKASKLSSRTLSCVFLGFPTDAPPWQFYHPRAHRFFSSQHVTFDETVCFYRLHLHASHPVPLAPLSLPVAKDYGAETAGAKPGGAETEGEGSGGAATRGAGSGGAATGGADSGGAASPSSSGAVGDPAGGPRAGQPLRPDLLARVQQSTAAAGCSCADVDGRRHSPLRSGGGLSVTTHVMAGGIAPTYGYFKFSPDRITVALLQGRLDLITWRESIEPQLEVAGLKGFVDSTVPIPPVDNVELRGEFCVPHLLTFMVISRCCLPVVKLARRSCRERLDTGHQAWHFILSTYQVRDDMYIGQLEEKMTHIWMGEQESATDYCNRARWVLAEMWMAGAEYSTTSYISHIVKGLPRGYNLMKRMMMVPGTRESLDKDSITSYILQEEAMQEAKQPMELLPQANYFAPTKLNQHNEDDTKGGRGRSTSRRPRQDANPGKAKQTSKKTSSTKDVDNSSSKSRGNGEASCSMVGVVEPTVSLAPEAGEDFQAVAAVVQANPMAVLLDSGCSHHLMGTKAVFVDMAPSDGVKHVRGFNEALQPIEGRGTIASQGEAGNWVLIHNMLYVLSAQANLLSAGKLKESGVQLQGDDVEMLLDAASEEEVALRTIISATKSTPDRLHVRLAHIGVDTIKSSAKHEVATGLNIKPSIGVDPPCVSCVGGKLARHTFLDKGSDAEEALAVVHIDLCGPFRVAALRCRLWRRPVASPLIDKLVGGSKQLVNDLAVDKEGELSAREESTDRDVVEVPIMKLELRRTDNNLFYGDAEEDEELPELDPDVHADPEHCWDIATMTVKEALASWKGEAVKAAMEEEIRSLIGMGTWELVERPRKVNIMKNWWVLTTKYRIDDTVECKKARLVVKGFTQVCSADYDKTYSPVSSYVTLRIFLSIVAIPDLNLMQLDMKNAFLQSKALDGVLLGTGWKKSQVDEALYFKAGDNGVTCWLREISPVVKYLGLEIVCDRPARKLWLHQQGYSNKLRRRFINEEQGGGVPKTPVSVDAYAELTFDNEEAQEREEEYWQKIGSLQFTATPMRPDIAFACSKLGSGLTVRSDQHWHEVDRCLAYPADTHDTALEFGGGPESLELIGYVDADDAGDKQTSTGGYVFVYGGAAVSWSSSHIKCATLSSTESEHVAATDEVKGTLTSLPSCGIQATRR
ncbi:unnamed protein product [Closterium sp. NIES-54]